MLKRLCIAGVSEQVNIPLQLCIEQGLFALKGLDVDFKVVPGGTGAMVELLEKKEVDVALTVTDGFIAGKVAGKKIVLAGTYVQSPLTWALVSRPGCVPQQLTKYGISRVGSGSQTMAFYNALLEGVQKDALEFTVSDNFDGLRRDLHAGKSDAFLWELFTTKPWIDSKELSLIKEVTTPWTAFSFVVSSEAKAETKETIKTHLFPVLREGVRLFTAQGARSEMVARICKEHKHTEADALKWLSQCEYAVTEGSPDFAVQRRGLVLSLDVLREAGVVPEGFSTQKLWDGDEKLITLM